MEVDTRETWFVDIDYKAWQMRIFYKANQIIRMAEAANLPVCIDWAQGSRPLDTATGQMHVALRLVACDPGMDYY